MRKLGLCAAFMLLCGGCAVPPPTPEPVTTVSATPPECRNITVTATIDGKPQEVDGTTGSDYDGIGGASVVFDVSTGAVPVPQQTLSSRAGQRPLNLTFPLDVFANYTVTKNSLTMRIPSFPAALMCIEQCRFDRALSAPDRAARAAEPCRFPSLAAPLAAG